MKNKTCTKKGKVKADNLQETIRLFPQNFQAETSSHLLRRQKKISEVRKHSRAEELRISGSNLWSLHSVNVNRQTESTWIFSNINKLHAGMKVCPQTRSSGDGIKAGKNRVKFFVTRNPLHVTPFFMPSAHFHIYIYIHIYRYVCMYISVL